MSSIAALWYVLAIYYRCEIKNSGASLETEIEIKGSRLAQEQGTNSYFTVLGSKDHVRVQQDV